MIQLRYESNEGEKRVYTPVLVEHRHAFEEIFCICFQHLYRHYFEEKLDQSGLPKLVSDFKSKLLDIMSSPSLSLPRISTFLERGINATNISEDSVKFEMTKIVPAHMLARFNGKSRDPILAEVIEALDYAQKEEVEKSAAHELPEYKLSEPLPTLPPDFTVLIHLPRIKDRPVFMRMVPEPILCTGSENIEQLIARLLNKINLKQDPSTIYALKVTGFHSYLLSSPKNLLTGLIS